MVNTTKVSQQILSIFPELKSHSNQLVVSYDDRKNVWDVWLKYKNRKLHTYLEDTEVEDCTNNNKCISLALQIAQLRANFEQLDGD